MRFSLNKRRLGMVGCFLHLASVCAPASALRNAGFEAGDLSGWSTVEGPLAVAVATNETFNRNGAARISGSYAGDAWITNSLYQLVSVSGGDDLFASGFVYWKTNDALGAGATGYVRVAIEGAGGSPEVLIGPTNATWLYFSLSETLWGVTNGGFERGDTSGWRVTNDHLEATVDSMIADAGLYALKFDGSWIGWSLNQAYQSFVLQSGDVVHARGRVYVEKLESSGLWLIAGIKLEQGGSGFESKVERGKVDAGTWSNLSFTAAITNDGYYEFRCMVAGGTGGASTSTVYFDSIEMWVEGETTGATYDVALRVDFCGYSGGASATSAVDIYVDSFLLEGSQAGGAPPTNILGVLREQAAAIGTNPAVDIPEVPYPALNTFGYPDFNTNYLNLPAYVEVGIAGWKFKWMTNDAVVRATNVLEVYALGTNGEGFVEFDQYAYVAKRPGKERFEPLDIDTNAPHFALGVKDGSSAEFGDGPFGAEHVYVVGTDLTNFPRRMTTDASGSWPRRLYIVFEENFSTNSFTNSLWQKHFVIATIPTNGEASNVKAAKLYLFATDAGVSNDLEAVSQEMHLGWAGEAVCHGMVDYPNLTYQDHNEVALRAGWLHNLVDRSGWYMAPSPRGSATIEPIDLRCLHEGEWVEKIYEEYLFTWPNAASGVRSIYDDDLCDRLRGAASYHVGFKVGHENGTNEMGEVQYPEVINLRGNGYFRMTDYDGVMAGSFRPMAADVFGLYQGKEDAPIIPEAYARVVPRTTPTNEPDDSYGQVFMPVRSKTNNWFVGTLKADLHFTPDEVRSNGCFFDLEADTWPNRDVVLTNDGALACFSQVSMHWRGGSNINDGTEGHDIDAVMVKKADGEWITHYVLNPPTNIVRRTLCPLVSNDVVYLMQQDRGGATYGFATEAPYRRASTFEITLLDDGGRDLSLDVYEQNTISEINDNVNITCRMDEDLAAGEHLRYRYRYRTRYAPGVQILSPRATGGEESWLSNNVYRIEFFATDGQDRLLNADLYYGNGLDGQWVWINTNEIVSVPTNSNRVSYHWDTAGIAPGGYYIKVEARRTDGGRTGFDVSDSRLQVGDVYGMPNNGSTNIAVSTNAWALLGDDMNFESGTTNGWGASRTNWNHWADHLTSEVSSARSYNGTYSARLYGTGWGGPDSNTWSYNKIHQDIVCGTGEYLYVTGRVYVAQFTRHPTSTNWLRLGMKLEATNGSGFAENWLDITTATGVWQTLEFTRAVSGPNAEELMLYVMGYDCSGVDVYFDHIQVVSTNTGTVVSNEVRAGYWEGDAPVDFTTNNVLSFRVAGTYGVDDLDVWAGDGAGTTNYVALTNFLERVVSLPQRVDVPWTDFAGLDLAQVRAVGFSSPAASNDAAVSQMRSIRAPLIARASCRGAPLADDEGLPHYNPGETVTNVIRIENVSGVEHTGLVVQAIQEGAEDLYWWDASPHVAAMWSAKARRGDRLCGGFEQVWTGRSIAAGGVLVLTNVYEAPRGTRVEHEEHELTTGNRDWYIGRNGAGRMRVHVVARTSGGDTLYDNEDAGGYAMDDDFDIDNDGMPDDWEESFSPSITGLQARADSDGDGFDNLAEYVAGTVPTSGASHPAVDAVEAASTSPATVWFQTATGRLYRLWWSEGLTNAVWQPLGTNDLAGDGGVQSIMDDDSLSWSNRYYKVGIRFSHGAWPF